VDGWLCQDCRSVNSPSAANCYSCWTPRKFAEAPDPATLPPGVTPEQAHAERQRQLRPTLTDARSSRRRSWIVLACITGTVAFSALNLAFLGAKGGSLGLAVSFLSGEWSTFGALIALSLVGGVLAITAAIAWFVWFDRVLANVPPLTGTWPEVSRVMAVVWWLVPVIGQLKGTFVVGHVYSLMAVAGSPGLWLLGLWGITWLGGTLVPGVAGFVVGWVPLPLEESIRLQDLISNLGQMSYITAGFFAAALILALEHARDVRTSGHAQDADLEAGEALADRLARKAAPVASTPPGTLPAPAWRGAPGSLPPPGSPAPPGWVAAPGSTAPTGVTSGPLPWPVPTTSWSAEQTERSAGPTPWSDGSAEWIDAPAAPWPAAQPHASAEWIDAPAAPWPAAQPQPPMPLASTGPVTNADPFEPPAAAARRVRERRPVPFEPILIMGALVLAGVVAGVTMAGMADPLGGLGGLVGQGPATPTARPLVTARPTPATSTGAPLPTRALAEPTSGASPAGTSALPAPTPTAASEAPPTPAASSTPVPADLVARRLVRLVTDEDYHGLADVDATYTDTSGDTTWSVRLGRAGEREWRLQEVQRPGAEPEVLERASLVSTTWERGARTDWERRRKTERDRAIGHLFDLTDAGQVSFRGLTQVEGGTLYRFGWDAGHARIQQFIRSLGGPDGLTLVAGELLATDRGVPVTLELRLTGEASGSAPAPTMRMSVEYSEVGSNIEIRSPRVGPPLVVRR